MTFFVTGYRALLLREHRRTCAVTRHCGVASELHGRTGRAWGAGGADGGAVGGAGAR